MWTLNTVYTTWLQPCNTSGWHQEKALQLRQWYLLCCCRGRNTPASATYSCSAHNLSWMEVHSTMLLWWLTQYFPCVQRGLRHPGVSATSRLGPCCSGVMLRPFHQRSPATKMYYELPSPDITILALFLEHSIQHIVFYKWEITGRPPETTYNVFRLSRTTPVYRRPAYQHWLTRTTFFVCESFFLFLNIIIKIKRSACLIQSFGLY